MDVRFIEVMPFDGNEWHPHKLVSYVEAVQRIRDLVRKTEREKCTLTLLYDLLGGRPPATGRDRH